MSKFYYARLTTPRRLPLGFDSKTATHIYADCAGCGEVDAVIHGQIRDTKHDMMACIPSDNGITMKAACYCKACFERIVEE